MALGKCIILKMKCIILNGFKESFKMIHFYTSKIPSALMGVGVKAGLVPHFNTCLRQAGRGARGDLKMVEERVIL